MYYSIKSKITIVLHWYDVDVIIFYAFRALKRLDERIIELNEEYEKSQQNFKDLHKQRAILKKERELRRDEIKALESKCVDLQMLKFGRVIELGT